VSSSNSAIFTIYNLSNDNINIISSTQSIPDFTHFPHYNVIYSIHSITQTILPTVAAVEAASVDTAHSIFTCAVPQTAFNECRLPATFLHFLFVYHVLEIQAWILNPLNLQQQLSHIMHCNCRTNIQCHFLLVHN